MSLPIHVEAYSGYKANERPIRFHLDEGTYEIEAIEDRWQDPKAEYFKVRTGDGKRYLLRYNQHADEWALQSGFDGAELLARPSIEVITVGAKTIRDAESRIAGCEHCRPVEAEQPFDWILADVLGKDGSFEFAMGEPAHCPNCNCLVTEKTLVEPQGGIEIETYLR